MNFQQISTILSAVCNLILSGFVFLKNPKARVNRFFALMSLCFVGWSMGVFLGLTAPTEKIALFWCRALHIPVILIAPTFVYFVFALIDKKINRYTAIMLHMSVIAIVAVVFTPLFLRGARMLSFGYYGVPGILHPLYILVFAIWASYGNIELFKVFKVSSGIKRNQIKYMFLGLVIGFVSGFTGFLPVYFEHAQPIGNITNVLYGIIIAYAIVKYRLMDINLALTRAGIFAVVYLTVLGIPFWIGIKILGKGLWILPVFIMGIFATFGPFIYTYLRRRADDVILKDQRRYQRALIDLSKTMGRIRDIDKLYKTIVFTVVDTIKVPFASIYLKDDEYKSYQLKYYFPKKAQSRFQEFVPLDHFLTNLLNQQKRPLLSEEIGAQDKINLDHGLVIPCFAEDELLGFLVLGPKPNNQMYTPDDILIFETLSYSTALAIENCKFWREIENRQRKARLQEMDSFAYSLAHEIDNPMTVLLNLPNFLRKHFLKYISDPQEQKDVDDTCKHMTQLAERVSGMVKAIRKFGEPTTGELSPLNLQEIIEGYSKLYAPEIKAHSIYFEKEMPAEPIYVNGVAAELQQVLIIFSNNAIHAMKYAEPKKITLKLTKANHNIARIAFSDTGYGIKPEKIETIFAPFVTSKASTEGTGMGLYNAKGLVLRHKGKIWAESEGHGKGATFIVELPIIEDIKPEDLTKKDETKWKF